MPNRRQFTTGTITAAAALAANHSTAAASERIRVGVIGVANRGGQLIDAFLPHSDCEIVAVCDVDSNTLGKAVNKLDGKPKPYRDFRQVIDRDDIDAIVVATPDHWHAIQTITACDAGKDVYCEKPLSIAVNEGRAMVNAARRNNRIVQVGTHRRSSKLYRELAPQVQDGMIGKVCVSRAFRTSNMYPDGIGKLAASDPPSTLDWNMWLGPRPERPYQDNIAPYKFRWWKNYSSQMGNWGVHYLDAIRWCTGDEAPKSVCAMGGNFAIDDDRTIPDTMQVTFEFESGRLAIFGQYETSGNRAIQQGEIELRGTDGTCYVSERDYEIVPESGGQFADRGPRMKPQKKSVPGGNALLTQDHARNFLDCIKSRELPNADVEIGHRSTTMSLIANISLAVGRRLEWDAQAERFINDDEANELLQYDYRAPWKLG
ncbi:Gfo/Idh/MocA family protein [Rhodopirellula sp. MGV]|uniref:Gfo/Idh/MocA family protein n=1 Tax=Rhodopirellula sp. MGV TaxID=2023130 RepID=UPI000B96D2C3|nr:Gfo/Idh/MocA family oxidoreductase [Rhodopirellula sp. MGV]OYP28866.1 dehydrogenase [Rhodopirellula sp. MGV]PNY37020.1 gfo/Idh/MocA family oxidoreductase [Rhodopirellula baltica]